TTETDQLSARARVDQNLRIDQVVVQYDVGLRQALAAAQCDQAGIARSAADQKNFADRLSHGLLKLRSDGEKPRNFRKGCAAPSEHSILLWPPRAEALVRELLERASLARNSRCVHDPGIAMVRCFAGRGRLK